MTGSTWWRGARRWTALAVGYATLVSGPMAGAAAPPAAPPPAVSARASVLLDGHSGQVLASTYPDRELPMASVTKLMTLVLAFRAIARGQVRLSDWVPVSEEAYRTEGSQIWLEPGERLTLEQMLTAIAVGSANDASVAVAQFLAGSTGAFVSEMNREAARLGMRHTHFDNPHGLPSLQHYSTAADLGRLAMAAVRMPGLLAATSGWQNRTIRNGKGGTLWLVNQNRLLRTYPGTDGLKTGYTRSARFCLVATTQRRGTRLIAVILGAPTSLARFRDAAALMSWGFSHFQSVPVVSVRARMGVVGVIRGRARRVAAVAQRSLWLTQRRGAVPARVHVVLPRTVEAPVRAEQRLGSAVVQPAGGATRTIPLVAAGPVPAVGLPELFWRFFRAMVAVEGGR